MSFWDITGGVDRTLVDGLPSGIDNDQGSIRYAGTSLDAEKWSNVALGAGSRITTIVSGINGISGISRGVFNGGDQVIRRVTTDIAGVSNNVLLAGASNSAKNSTIHQTAKVSTHFYKTAIRTNKWSQISGAWEVGFPTTSDTGVWDQATDGDEAADLLANNTDNAANPTAAIPGEFVYRDGSPTPVQDNYKAKTVF